MMFVTLSGTKTVDDNRTSAKTLCGNEVLVHS